MKKYDIDIDITPLEDLAFVLSTGPTPLTTNPSKPYAIHSQTLPTRPKGYLFVARQIETGYKIGRWPPHRRGLIGRPKVLGLILGNCRG